MNFFKNKKKEEEFSSTPIKSGNWFESLGQLVVDVYKDDENLFVRSPIAGITTDNISIAIEHGILKITGKREVPEKEDGKSYFIKECFWGDFSREIVLPVDVNGQETKAKISQGILLISMPIIKEELDKVQIN